MTQAAAATKQETAVETTRSATHVRHVQVPTSLQERLVYKQRMARKYRSTVRFFETRRHLLSSPTHGKRATTALRRARSKLARVNRTIAAIRRVLARREARRQAALSPRVAICDVFGRRYCRQAIAVAWCESRLSTYAQNGQYLGLFQMGSNERQLFGHGGSARAQARAAHRYFVVSGRDWSPWSCKPWYAY